MRPEPGGVIVAGQDCPKSDAAIHAAADVLRLKVRELPTGLPGRIYQLDPLSIQRITQFVQQLGVTKPGFDGEVQFTLMMSVVPKAATLVAEAS